MENDQNPNIRKKQFLVQSLKFVLFSCTAGIVQVISFSILHELRGFAYWPSYLTALILSVLYNFTINRRYTFRSANNVPLAMLKVLGYYVVFTPLSTWWGDSLTNIGWNPYVVLIGTMLINFVTEFLFWRFVVFHKSIDTNEVAMRKLAIREKPDNESA